MTRLVNQADIVNKTRPLFTLSLEMTRLVNKTRLLLVSGITLDIIIQYTFTSTAWNVLMQLKSTVVCISNILSGC